MSQINLNYLNLKENYLFAEIARKVAAFTAAHPEADVIRMGIGDVTRPLAPAVISAMQKATAEMGSAATFHGYGDEQGYPFLQNAIAGYYRTLHVALEPAEIFISDGAKSDLGNILDLFAKENTVLIPDPVYPVYVDTNLMDGRKILFLNATEKNGFLPPPPEGLEGPQLLDWYAGALLGQLPCMRMNEIGRRSELLEQPRLRGILYHTVKFCDYYSFEYEALRSRTSLPLLKLETDFTPQGDGQLSTRLEAFAEQLNLRGAPAVHTARRGRRYVAGIDSGSTTTNLAILDLEGSLRASAIVRTGPKARQGAEKALAALEGIGLDDLAAVVATGYGRSHIPFATGQVTEITCHARGAHHLHPQARCVIDIGGQDSKVICLDEDGGVKNFVMNDKCAAGTGRFLEMMARVLEVELAEMGTLGLRWETDLTISSICTVFAESEVVSLIADNHSAADIVHGLNRSVAVKTAALVQRAGGCGPYLMTGGVARNQGVVQALEERLGAPLWIGDTPDLCGALGAALFALDHVTDKGGPA